jgi:hypothetical protein
MDLWKATYDYSLTAHQTSSSWTFYLKSELVHWWSLPAHIPPPYFSDYIFVLAPLAMIDTNSHVSLTGPWISNLTCAEGVDDTIIHDDCSHDSIDCKHGPLAPFAEKIIRPRAERKRRVTFSETIEVNEVQHSRDASDDETVATWWTPNDYMLIRKMFKITIQMIIRGETFADDDKDFCTRGLEFLTKSASQRHCRNKQRVVKAVLKAQGYQRYEGFNDPEYIAELCAEYTRSSTKGARLMAIVDEQSARSMIYY